MAKYSECPNCGNSEDGYAVYVCSECSHLGCFKGAIFGSGDGCWMGSNCPECGEHNSYRNLGYIRDDD